MEQKQINPTVLNASALEILLEELAQKNWAVSSQVFSFGFCQNLARECQNLALQKQLQKASIGRGNTKAIHSEIRGDFISWLEESHIFLAQLELLRHSLNQLFFLGLQRVEAHYALYPPGTGYDKHIDNHQGANHRKITFVLYLNEHWQKSYGGELSLYNSDDSELFQVEPQLGTLILFRSDLFPHQVEKSSTNRMSLTGWFRDDALL